MAVPSQRGFLRWFHRLEDDDANSAALQSWDHLSQAAVADGPLDSGETDGLAELVIELADDDLIEFDPSKVFRKEEFGENPSVDLQHATNFRSTAKGRNWLREPAASGLSISLHGSHVGQVAGRDITNQVSFTQILDMAATALDRMEADEEERQSAREFLDALGGRAAEAGTGMVGGAGGYLAGRALASVLGIPV